MKDERFELTRRKALAGLGGIGLASAGAGLGTSAYFNDTESFTGNSVQAGELNLIVDYETSVEQGDAGSSSDSGEIDGNPGDYSYAITDAKPGDSGSIVFCPKVVDNPAWVYVGSASGLTDYENGQTEPEAEVDASRGGDLDNGTNDGAGAGELSHAIQVTVSYCDDLNGSNKDPLNNPADYTLADLLKDLQSGFLLDGDQPNGDADPTAYPGSDDDTDQQGPCICIDWDIPASVGNEIQSDAVEFDFQFQAIQERHNPDSTNPFVDITVGSGSTYDYNTIQAAVDAASTGDVISVTSGTFAETVTISTGLTLVAEPGTTPTIHGGGSNAAVDVAASGVTIDGFDVTNPGGLLGISLDQNVDNVVICNNRIYDVGPTGALGVTGINVKPGTHSNIRIVHNVIENLKQEINESSGYPTLNGILFDAAGGFETLLNTVVANNTIRGLESDIAPLGLVLQPGALNVTIEGNVMSDFRAAHEVDSDDTDDASGEYTTYAQGISIDSSLTDNLGITGNVFEASLTSEDGYWAEAIKIESTVDVSGISINGNDLLPAFGLNNAASDPVDATNNYWNSSSGPNTSQSQDGTRTDATSRPSTASVALGPADVDPFLSSSIQ